MLAQSLHNSKLELGSVTVGSRVARILGSKRFILGCICVRSSAPKLPTSRNLR